MNWRIKKFEHLSVNELYDILRLRTEVFILEQKCFYQECDEKDKHSYHVFAYDDNDILVAYLRIIINNTNKTEVTIGRVVVSNKYRGMDIGYAMMDQAIAYIKDIIGAKIVKLAAQEYAQGFYKKLGFEPCSDVFEEDGIPHLHMYKKL